MADGLNRVLLIGNLGADPELKITAGNQAVLKLRIATTESYLDKSNTRQERTEWHSVSVWGRRGEALHKFLAKGKKLFVEGSLRTSSYEKEGQKLYRTEIVATNIILLDGRGRDSGDELDAPRGAPRSASRPASPPSHSNDDMFPPPGLGHDDIPF